jgi:transposase
MEPRKLRGAEIARAGGIRRKSPDLWVVPSQSHKGSWLVDYDTEDGQPVCTCPDFAERWKMCKHIFAIEIAEKRIAMPSENPPKQKKYTQNWAAYNAAQTNERAHFVELLHSLCQGIDMPEQTGRGRPRNPLADVVFALVTKVYSGKSGRRAHSEIKRCHDEGYLSTPVSYNSLSDYMRDPELTPLLRVLLRESAAPLAGIERNIAIDSTGFPTTTYDRWFDQKWGKKKKRAKFVKTHMACGVRTHVVTDLIISPRGDSTQFEPLLEGTRLRFEIDEVSADKAYSSYANLEAVEAAGAVPFIPFKEGTTGKNGPAVWRRMFHYFQFKRDEFDAHYHRRSNGETTFSMVKGKFDGPVKSKSQIGQANEVYCKFLCHNIVVLVHAIYEHDLVPEFWTVNAQDNDADSEVA